MLYFVIMIFCYVKWFHYHWVPLIIFISSILLTGIDGLFIRITASYNYTGFRYNEIHKTSKRVYIGYACYQIHLIFNKICLNWIDRTLYQLCFIHYSIYPCFMSISVVGVFIVSWFYKNNLLILNHHINFINILIWMQKFKPFWKAQVVYSHESAQVILLSWKCTSN